MRYALRGISRCHIHAMARTLYTLMVNLKRIVVFAVLLAELVAIHAVQPALAQTTGTALQLLQTASGNIGDVTPEQRWAFNATAGQRLSVRMQATSGNLEPS